LYSLIHLATIFYRLLLQCPQARRLSLDSHQKSSSWPSLYNICTDRTKTPLQTVPPAVRPCEPAENIFRLLFAGCCIATAVVSLIALGLPSNGCICRNIYIYIYIYIYTHIQKWQHSTIFVSKYWFGLLSVLTASQFKIILYICTFFCLNFSSNTMLN
jgi:hypothetical protein